MVYPIWVTGIMVNPFSTILGICYGKNISPLGLPPIYKLHEFIAKDNDMAVFLMLETC